MDWPTEHKANIIFELKKVTLWRSKGKEVIVVGERTQLMSNLVSMIKAEKMLDKGYKVYLAFVMSSQDVAREVRKMWTIQDFPDMFHNDQPALPPDREVEFAVELYPGSSSISITSYRIAPKKIKELKIQLQELLDKGFIWPSLSPWGSPVLFVKEDDSMRMYIDYR